MSKDMSISDLLPLVAVALNDQAAADAAKELDTALKERDTAYRVEVLRARNNGDDEDENEETIVYASALFEDGYYVPQNTNLWSLDFRQDKKFVCRLADLRDCHVCVGGGFPVASLDNNLPNNLFGGSFGSNIGDSIEIRFCFCPHSTWLTILVHGWPREEWEAMMEARDEPEDFVGFLVETVAAQYSDATVEFTDVCFVAKRVQGALKRLLPKRLNEAKRKREDGM